LEEQIALKLADGTISLDEVVVTENQEKDDKFQFTADLEGRLIRDVDIRKSPSVASYIQRLGFSVRISEGKLRAFSRMYPYPEAPIIIEGMVASQGEVIGMPLSRVQFVSYKKSRTTPFISIVLNQNYVSPENRNQYVKFLIQEGFTKPQEYFDPGYGQLESSLFQRYGVINWKSRINVTNDIPTSITIPTYGQNKIRLYVEGMSINGGLVSQEKTISISSN
jgi:hypothetical protein